MSAADGNFITWTGGVTAGLLIAAVTGSIVFDVRIAREIAKASTAIEVIERDLSKLERRLEFIERR